MQGATTVYIITCAMEALVEVLFDLYKQTTVVCV